MLLRVFCLSVAASTAAFATDAESASGDAYDVAVSVSVAGLPALNVPPNARVTRSAQPAPFDDIGGVLNYDSGPGPIRLATGTTSVETEWRPSPEFFVLGSRASVVDASLAAMSVTSQSFIALQANEITSTVVIAGHCPVVPAAAKAIGAVDDALYADNFDARGLDAGGGPDHDGGDGADDSGVAISLLGITLPTLPLHPAPNTTIDLPALGILGATLILNERTTTGDGITTRGVAANGLHLTLNVLGVITADAIFAHSEAAIDCGA